MIVGAAFCPQPPVLVPAVASGAAAELDDLRAASLAAIDTVSEPGAPLVLLGAGAVSRQHSPLARGSLAPYGVDAEVELGSGGCGGAVELPLSLTVGAWLVREALGSLSGATAFTVGRDFAGHRVAAELLRVAEEGDVALVILGDGSARRSTAAPGHLDERAAPFDDAVAAVLRAGDADGLGAIDLALADELMATGAPVWRAAARLLAGAAYRAELTAYADPFGVAYFVATWLAGQP